MPNWATGTLKIRGKKEDILKFCKEKMKSRAYIGTLTEERDKKVEWDIERDSYGDGDYWNLTATVRKEADPFIYLEDSRRNFVSMDTRVPYYWEMEHEGDEYVTIFTIYKLLNENSWCVVFPFMAAWGVDEDYYANLSKEYHLIFKIYVVEQGMGFFDEFQASEGKIELLSSGPKGDAKLGSTYGNFVWECPFPFLGG